MTGGWHIAQVNVALPREQLDSPAPAELVANLEPVNALADCGRRLPPRNWAVNRTGERRPPW